MTHIRCKTSLRFGCRHLSRTQGAAALGFVVHRLRRNQTHAQPLAPARQLVRASRFRSPISHPRSPISHLRSSSFQLPAPQPTRCRPMEYGDSSPFSSAPRSALTVRGPPQLAPTPFVVPPSGGLSFPAEAGTPAGSSHLEQATGRPLRSTLQFDSVGHVHDSEVGTHRCGHNLRISPEGTSLIKPRVEPMRGTSEAQPWVTRTTENGSPKGWP